MKSVSAIKSELTRLYQHRLQLRIDRKTKPCCRNCQRGIAVRIDLGEFGESTKYTCREEVPDPTACQVFMPMYTPEMVEEEMMKDIKDPAVCGAKEPKIAALLWVLHQDDSTEDTFFNRVRGFFKRHD